MQRLNAGLVNHRVSAGSFSQRLQDALHRITLHHAAIGTERLIVYRQDVHRCIPPILSDSVNLFMKDSPQTGEVLPCTAKFPQLMIPSSGSE